MEAEDSSDYRVCSQCGGECFPDPFATEAQGPRIAFVCPEHGLNAVINPFESDF